MNVLVTGGAGYIGAHLIRLLAARGYEPIVLDDFRNSSPERVAGFEVAQIPLEDRNRVLATFRRYRPRHVFHLAGYISVAESMQEPEKYWDNNVRAGISLLAACQHYPIDTFVFSSSAAVYGVSDAERLDEASPLAPASVYGATKLAFERRLHAIARSVGFSSAALRYFNACGCHPEWGVGEAHEPEEHLIPNVIRAALDGRPIRIYGDNYPTADGTCERDFIHVMDLAEAHVAVINRQRRQVNDSYNVGTGSALSVRDVVETMLTAVGHSRDLPISVEPRRPGDPPRLVADSTRFCESFGWSPRWSRIDRIIKHALGWERLLRADAAAGRPLERAAS